MSLYVKFTSLFLKTISKPIANGIKAQAKEHASFRKVCISFAQGVHRADVNVRRRLLGEKDIKVRPLNDAKAINSGANFLADSFVFGVGGAIIFFEYYRQRRKEAARRAGLEDDIRVLQDEVDWLVAKLQDKQILSDNYTVPDDVETSILELKHKDGTTTKPKNEQEVKAKQALKEARQKEKEAKEAEAQGNLSGTEAVKAATEATEIATEAVKQTEAAQK